MNQPNLWKNLSSVNLPFKTVENSKNFTIETVIPILTLKNLKLTKGSQITKTEETQIRKAEGSQLTKAEEWKIEIEGSYLKIKNKEFWNDLVFLNLNAKKCILIYEINFF